MVVCVLFNICATAGCLVILPIYSNCLVVARREGRASVVVVAICFRLLLHTCKHHSRTLWQNSGSNWYLFFISHFWKSPPPQTNTHAPDCVRVNLFLNHSMYLYGNVKINRSLSTAELITFIDHFACCVGEHETMLGLSRY